jgi:hypothetical protein
MNVTYPIADIGMAGFSVFFMQSPSFLAHQKYLEEGQGRSNCETPFGISKMPGDSHIRDMLDPVDPALLHPVFDAVLVELKQAVRRLVRLPPTRSARADRLGRHGVLLFQRHQLPELLDADARQRQAQDRILPHHAVSVPCHPRP